MGDWTGTVPTILAGDVVTGDNWKTVLDIETALTGAWTTWVPTLTNLTLGTGTVTAKYRRVGKTIDFYFRFVFGASGSAVGTSPTISLPAAISADFPAYGVIGDGYAYDVGSVVWWSTAQLADGRIGYWPAAGTLGAISSTLPFTWAVGDTLSSRGTYYTD